MYTSLKTGVVIPVFLAVTIWTMSPIIAKSDLEKIEYQLPLGVIIVNSNSILQAKSPSNTFELASKFLIYVTAYSSSEDETDSTPHITASGTRTRDGVIASNIFPLGTKIKIPEFFGNRIFTVEDRMHQRFTDRLDVWMPSKWNALAFGKRHAAVEIVEL